MSITLFLETSTKENLTADMFQPNVCPCVCVQSLKSIPTLKIKYFHIRNESFTDDASIRWKREKRWRKWSVKVDAIKEAKTRAEHKVMRHTHTLKMYKKLKTTFPAAIYAQKKLIYVRSHYLCFYSVFTPSRLLLFSLPL